MKGKLSLFILIALVISSVETYKVMAEQDFSVQTQNNSDEFNQIIYENKKIEEELIHTLQQIQEKEIEIVSMEEEIKKNEEDISQTNTKINQLQRDIDELSENLIKREQIIKIRLQSLQKNGGNISYLEVLLGAQDFDSLINRISLVSTIMWQDRDIIERQKEDKEQLNTKKIALSETQSTLEQNHIEMEQKKEQLVKQREELSNIKRELNNQLRNNNVQLSELKAQNELIKKSQLDSSKKTQEGENEPSQPISKNKRESLDAANFVWPTIGGTITTYQGMRWGEFHKGIDIAAPLDYSILAANSGKITFAGWINGYGNTIKIDHNNGYTTQYAHLSKIGVKDGENVSKGSKIGIMGSTGYSTGVHLDFEVYYYGKVINPLNVLP